MGPRLSLVIREGCKHLKWNGCCIEPPFWDMITRGKSSRQYLASPPTLLPAQVLTAVAGPTFQAQNGPIPPQKREPSIHCEEPREGCVARTKRVRRLMLRTSPQPNNAHRRTAPTELHALASPFTVSVLTRGCLSARSAGPQPQYERKHSRASSAHRPKRPSPPSRSRA